MKLNALVLIVMMFFCSCGNKKSTKNINNSQEAFEDEINRSPGNSDTTTLLGVIYHSMAKIDTMTMTGDPEVDFSRIMIEHHNAAIKMAQMQLVNGVDDSLISIAKVIIGNQEQEKRDLGVFASRSPQYKNKEFVKDLRSALKSVKGKMSHITMSTSPDENFAFIMSMHHQQAISIDEIYNKHGRDRKLRRMVREMANDQENQIKELQETKDQMSAM